MKELKFKKTLLIPLIIIMLVILVSISMSFAIKGFEDSSRVYVAGVVDSIHQRVTSLFSEINNFPHSAENDLLFIKNSRYLHALINSNSVDFQKTKIELEDYLLEFSKVNEVYYQIKYIDEDGQEIIKINFDGYNHSIIPENELENLGSEYYFEKTMELGENDIYVSALDINRKNGNVENRGTEENPIYVPVIRYAMPVFNDAQSPKGIIIFKIYADYFLEDIRRFQRQGEQVFLLDNDGYYLAHPNRSKEFSFVFDRKEGFFNDYPKINKDILNNFDQQKIETKDNIFTFKFIYPALGSFEIYEGSKKIFGETPENEYYWVLVSISEKRDVEKIVEKLKVRKNTFLLTIGIIAGILFILVLLLAYKDGVK